MSNLQLTVEAINAMQPLDIVTNPTVRDRFIQIYDTLWGAGTGEAAYERESFHFNNKLRDDQKLRDNSTRFSIFSSFIDLAIMGLSCEPGSRAQCYLQGRNTVVGKDQKGNNLYEGRLTVTISGYGELYMRARQGQIRHADNPVLVYEEDTFSFGEQNGQKVVNYMCNLPHKSGRIVAAYLKITRTDGSVDYSVMLPEDWQRLCNYSERNNKRWNNQTRQYEGKANELYTSNNGQIDTGFLFAKLIKHAFRTYPKVRIGKYTQFESQQEDTTQQEINDFYGIQPSPDTMPNDFGPNPDYSAGVRIDPAATVPAASQAVPAAPSSSASAPVASGSAVGPSATAADFGPAPSSPDDDEAF